MGIITVEQIVSADGYAADAEGGIDFFAVASFGDESRTDSTQMRWLESVDAILLGRNTYEMFAAHWPTADPAVDAVAGPIAALPKHVVTSTLKRAPWGDGEIEILGGDPVAAATAMRQRYASTVVWGSLQLSAALFEAGLVDEVRLRVVPALIGSGKGFTGPTFGTRALRLRSAEGHDTGHISVNYSVVS